MRKTSILLIISLFLTSSHTFAFTPVAESKDKTAIIAQVDDPDIRQNILDFAQKITVQVITDNNKGSGTLIGQQGNSYLILTNAHVVNYGKTFTIVTYDGKQHTATIVGNPLPDGYDLALLRFTSEQEYTIAQAEDITVPKQENLVFAGGYVAETGEFRVTEGKITEIPTQQFKEGYNIGYTNDIDQGMSGGPIITSQMLLVGINGSSTTPMLIYQDGTIPNEEEIKQFRQLSWGIPINTLLTYIQKDILTAYNLPLPQSVSAVEIPSYTGWPGELEKKARQFTVKIDSSSEANGSGVIIAKEGNIYTVLTADYVLCEKPLPGVLNQPCFDYIYTLTTHDGKTYPINKSTIIRQKGVDLAVFKFESSESYPLAEIANYNPNNGDHVFVAGFPKIGDKAPKWMFSGGLVYDKEEGLLKTRQDDYQTPQIGTASSLTGGYELVYTSITYGGIGGGPVLDAAGRVIGIHGRAEGAAQGTIRHLGYSLGIPISTFVGLQDKFTVNLPSITTLRPQISVKQSWDLFKAIVNVKVPDTNATADIWIERGGQLWRLFRYSDAIKAFDEAIKQNNPENVYLAWYGKGLALGSLEQYQAAIEALQQAINTLPTEKDLKEFHSSILTRQSVLYSYLQDYEKALTAINKALYLSPDNPNLYNEKYQILSKLKRYDQALEAINNAIELAPRAIWYVNRGNLYKNQQKWDLALADYTRAIDINPNYANAYYNRALLYTDLQKWDLAETDYNKAIALNPNLATLYYNRGSF